MVLKVIAPSLSQAQRTPRAFILETHLSALLMTIKIIMMHLWVEGDGGTYLGKLRHEPTYLGIESVQTKMNDMVGLRFGISTGL